MLLISGYSLLLLKTIPTTSGGKSYFTTQLIAVIVGYLGAILFSLVDYRAISSYWYLAAGFCLFLIFYTKMFGMAVVGSGGVNSKAWISLPGGITFQPSELVKIGFIITFSKHLSILSDKKLLKSPLQLLLILIHGLIPVMLVHLQGDDGDAIIFFCLFITMAFGAGIQLRYFAAMAVALGAGLPMAWKYLLRPYQKQRFQVTYNLESDPLNYGLQQMQGRISIGSGGLWGRGLFHSPRVAESIVPIQQSDFIFSVAGEQLGFIGCCAIILLLLLFLWRTLHTSYYSTDMLGRSICFGFFGMIFAQIIFNIGMCLDLLPVIGITLPFFSAGGSSASCLYFGFGLVQNVKIHRLNLNKAHIQ